MEDDDDSQSHVSLDSDKSPAINTVADVTVANPPPPPPLTLALPIQQPSSSSLNVVTINGGGGGGGGREDCWSEEATSVLIDAWGERYTELSRGNLKQKHWQEVADIVSSREDYRKTPKTDIQCKNRIDTVKKKYKTEKAKVASGGGPSRWPFFERLDRLIGPSALASLAKGPSGSGGAVVASVSPIGTASQKAVPMGIPVRVPQPQPLPFKPLTRQEMMLKMYNTPSLPSNLPLMRMTSKYNHNANLNHNQMKMTHPKYYHNTNLNHNQMKMLTPQELLLNASNVGDFSRGQQQQSRRGVVVPPPVDSESEREGWSNDSEDSLPPETGRKRGREEMSASRKKGRKGKKVEVKEWGSSVRELTRAILKFGEAYEAAERAKLEHIVEMEKQRMKFAKELELQRMKFLMKTQLELSQLNENGNSDSRGGGGSSGRRGVASDVGGGNRLQENHVDHANSDSSH